MTARAGAPVVVGVDGSPRSLTAVEAAATEAALRHCPLRLVHAFGWPSAGVVAGPGMVGPALLAYRDRAHDVMAEAARLAGKRAPGIVVTAAACPGPTVPMLLAESHDAALVVLGDRGFGGFTGLAIGSVTVQAVTHASCPVLIVRGDPHPRGPVLAGVDGSANSMAALAFAAEEAVLRNVELVTLHAWTADDDTELNDDLTKSYEFWSGEEERRVLAEALAGIAERYPDLPLRREIRYGSARRLLTDWSSTAQLVVVGNRGHGGFTGLLLGSVSQHLVHRAACPTAVVRPPGVFLNGASAPV